MKFPPVGVCIYCGSQREPLNTEHIIPYGLNGTKELPRSSCNRCEKITGAFEGVVLRKMYGPLRTRLNLRTRRKKERPKSFNVAAVNFPSPRVEIPADRFPVCHIGLLLGPPDFVTGRAIDPDAELEIWAQFNGDEYLEHTGFGRGFGVGTIHPLPFARMIAKIAHSLAVGMLGVNSFEHYLPDLILGRTNAITRYIGGNLEPAPAEQSTTLHRLDIEPTMIRGEMHVLVTIRLFCFWKGPVYGVVVGKCSGNRYALLEDAPKPAAVNAPFPMR